MKEADVCFVLEGTYPYVAGGVSSWVHMLMEGLPHVTFRVLHIASSRHALARGPVYDLPSNVLGVHDVLLEVERSRVRPRRIHADDLAPLMETLGAVRSGRSERFRDLPAAVDLLARASSADIVSSHAAWDLLVETYRAEAPHESFLQYYWTWVFMHMPYLQVLRAKIPPARVYHTACTGYAGLLAATAKVRTGRPMLMTEHGIYTKERRIEFNQAQWIRDWDPREIVARPELPFFEGFWGHHFETMSRIGYHYADGIYTLFDGNRDKQVLEGADPAKVHVVPNGIDHAAFEAALASAGGAQRTPSGRFTVGFVGRLTPVKDLVTLLRAMRLVADRVPELAVDVLGPDDEDSSYAAQCRRQAQELGLADVVTFRGRGNTARALPGYDVLVLTSISEAQPLVVLEAGAAGVPVVATAVGSCPELLLGGTSEDRALGAGGILTPIASPGATAEAVLRLHASPELRRRMGEVLRTRVERSYGMGDMIASYGRIYADHGQAA